MQASSAVSTIFRCMSCSFGTRNQTSYAEHIKHCNKEPGSGDALADDQEGQESSSLPVKKRYNSFVCPQCSIPTFSLKALLLHLRDVHGSDSRIFACKYCSRYAATSTANVYRHVKSQHPEGMLKGGKMHKELVRSKTVVEKHAAKDEANVEKHSLLSSDASQGSSPVNHSVKSSRSLGLHFLGKQFPAIGSYAFVCQLCSFSHVSSPVVVTHIWKEHRDKLSDVTTEADAMPASHEPTACSILYKCDDCPYSTQTRCYFFSHCSHHRFNHGHSKCQHCSFSALTDKAVKNHLRRCHGTEQPSDANSTPSTSQIKKTCTGVPGLATSTKKNRNRPYRKVYAKCRTVKKYSCPYCSFKSTWKRSTYRHKMSVHAQLVNAGVTESHAVSISHSHKRRNACVAVADTSQTNATEELKLVSKTSSSNSTSAFVKCDVYECDICFRKMKSLKALKAHKQVHMNLRRFKCSLCGLRGNYRSNMYAHVQRHKGRKAWVISLSLADAKATIEAYKKQAPILPGDALTQSKLPFSAVDESFKALRADTSSPTEHVPAKSSEHNAPKRKHLSLTKNSDGSDSGEAIGARRLKNYYMCSVCKRRSDHKSSIHRHITTVHFGKGAKLIIKSEVNHAKVSRQQSCQTTNKRKMNDAREKNSQQQDNVVMSGVEVGAQDVGRSISRFDNFATSADSACDSESAQSMVLPKNVRFVCEDCPYTCDKKSMLATHRRYHVKQPGCSFECSYCPYFVHTAGNLERHMRMHRLKQSADSLLRTPTRRRSDRKCRYLCELCPFKTHKRATAMYHKQLHRPRVSAPYKCKYCPFWAPHHLALSSHTKLHTSSAEAGQTCTKNDQWSQVSNDAEMDPQKHTVTGSLPSEDNEVSVSPVKNIGNTTVGKASEVVQSKPVNNGDKSADKSGTALSVAGQNADISVSSTVTRHMPTWFCDRCPYSATTLPSFKRHEWLHGKHYQYECCYCDYSVQSYWQLVSHVLWHFEPNRHLLYAQSVSNLDSVPSQLPDCQNIRDPVASINRFVPSFENSDVFLLSDESNFQCHCCPYTVDQRSEFFAHMICHCTRIGYGCPHCSFHADVSEKLTAHVFLHFNLPGCRQSAIPPNVCHSVTWKHLDATIEAIAERRSCNGEQLDEQKASSKFSIKTEPGIDSVLLSQTDDYDDAADMPQTGHSENEEKPSVPVNVVCHKAEDTEVTVPQPTRVDAASDISESADSKHPCDPVSMELEASELLLVESNGANCCQYCDRVIDDSHELTKHISGHLVGFTQS